jgi:integrase
LMKLPPNMNKDKRYRDLSIKETLKLEDVKPISTTTVNNHLAFVIAFMNWARKHGYIVENYFEDLKIAKPKKASDERKPFSIWDLKKIFNPKTYLEETKGYDFRYWVPLLALFTGGRLGELTQLHKSDIVKKEGLWCTHITEDGGTTENPKKLKNKSSERLVPVHPQLIELGFIDYVQQQKKNKETVRLFPELTFNKADYFSRRCGRWFNQFYLRKKLEIDDPLKTFHSLRHTVGNGLKQKKILESYISELLGHSSGDTMSFGRYGQQYRPKVLMDEAVQKIDYTVEFNDLKR